MIPRLADDPAWVRYQWELEHLPFVILRRALVDLTATVGESLVPVLRAFGDGLARVARDHKKFADAFAAAPR